MRKNVQFDRKPVEPEPGAVRVNQKKTPPSTTAVAEKEPEKPRTIDVPEPPLEPSDGHLVPGSFPGIEIPLVETGEEFKHLYAVLERNALLAAEEEDPDAKRSYVLGVTSSVTGEGKTALAAHLAISASRNTFSKVCLIDLGLGEDDVSRHLGLPIQGKGTNNLLELTDNTLPIFQLDECDDLVVVPSGKKASNPARIARSPRVAELIASARKSFDLVVVDLPAVSSDNVAPFTRHLDGVIMVVYSGATPKEVITRSVDQVGRDKVIGLVLNRVKTSRPRWMRKRIKVA